MPRPVSLTGKQLATAKAAFKRVLAAAEKKGISLSELSRKAGYPANAIFRWTEDGYCSRFAAVPLGKLKLGATAAQLRPDISDWKATAKSSKLFRVDKPKSKRKTSEGKVAKKVAKNKKAAAKRKAPKKAKPAAPKRKVAPKAKPTKEAAPKRKAKPNKGVPAAVSVSAAPVAQEPVPATEAPAAS